MENHDQTQKQSSCRTIQSSRQHERERERERERTCDGVLRKEYVIWEKLMVVTVGQKALVWFYRQRRIFHGFPRNEAMNNPLLCLFAMYEAWWQGMGGDVSIMTQIIKRPDEGIAATDGAVRGRRVRSAPSDLDKKERAKKILSEVAQLWVLSRPTLLEVAQPTYSGRQT